MRGLVTLAKSGPFLRSALQQPQIEIDINSTFVLDVNTEVWELNMCGVSKKPSVEKLWREKANMQMIWSSPSAAFAQFRDQRNAAAT